MMARVRLFSLSLLSLTLMSSAFAALGNPEAKKGGVFKYNIDQQPTTLNPLSSTDFYASQVQSYVLEGLLERNTDTYEWQSALATEWKISSDELSYEFKIREGVKWHDGKPFTAEDVKFSFDAIMEPNNKYKTAHQKPYYENIKEVKILDGNRVVFIASKKYFKNFEVCATMTIVPKHIYESPTKEQEKKLNRTLIGTGPYSFEKLEQGKAITLKGNKEWWGHKDANHVGENNFSSMLLRFVNDSTMAIQRTEIGDLDYVSLTAEDYVQKTNSPKWGKDVFKVKIENKAPKGYGFIGWNMKNEMFQSKKVRLAMFHLINREDMIKKFRYGYGKPATGPWYMQSEYADTSVKAIEFDPKKALEILNADGWKDTDGDKILDKEIGGKKVKLSFTILEPNQEFIKYLTVFKEDAKQAGVDVNVKFVEWNTFIKLLDEKNFEAVRLAWSGGSVDLDPKQIWHSESANGGSNFINYSNPQVDKLIDEARETLDKKQRIAKLKKVYRMIADDVPYAFFFNDDAGFYGHTKRLKRVKDTYQYGVGLSYWWIGE